MLHKAIFTRLKIHSTWDASKSLSPPCCLAFSPLLSDAAEPRCFGLFHPSKSLVCIHPNAQSSPPPPNLPRVGRLSQVKFFGSYFPSALLQILAPWSRTCEFTRARIKDAPHLLICSASPLTHSASAKA